MMKKIFSKRSGFTLVEIVVAFAVFAIMAGMILQVLNLVMMEKQNNADFAEKLQKQEELIVKNGRTGEYKDEDKTGTLSVTFGKDKYDIDYQMMFPETEDKKSRYEDGLAYYIGPGEKGSNADDDIGGSIDVTAGAGAQMERMDTRITGTGGFKSINVYRVVKDETYSGDGARYFIEVSADGSEMANEIVPYAQYKLYFFMKDELDAEKSNINYTAPDGSTYKRKVPKEATIIDAGYVNDTDLNSGTFLRATSTQQSPPLGLFAAFRRKMCRKTPSCFSSLYAEMCSSAACSVIKLVISENIFGCNLQSVTGISL